MSPIRIVFLTLLSALSASAAPITFYLSPTGNDASAGTLAKPFATLAHARDIARARPAAGPVRILLRGGTYYLPEPLVLTPEDSDTEFAAYPGEKPVISAGVPVTGFKKTEGNIWSAPVPAALAQGADFRQLRAGSERQIRARTPNFDPKNPYTGGWLFTHFPSDFTESGFGDCVASIHNAGDTITWEVDIPAAGEYRWLFYYGADNKPFGRDNMNDRTQVTVDDGVPALLGSLPDTGGWQTMKWSDTCATLKLTAGKHTIQWRNNQGGGLNLDAFMLTDDPDYRPAAPRGAGVPPATGETPAPRAGLHAIVKQCEDYREAKGPELTVTKGSSVPAYRDHFSFKPGELKAWPGLADAELYVFPAWGWVSTRCGLAGIDEKTSTVTLAAPGCEQEIRIGNRYYIENVRAALDSPGEWFFDKAESRLYYWPRSADFERQGVVLAKHDRAIAFRGDSEKKRYVQNVTLRGLTIADTSYTARVADVYYPEDAAIWLDAAKNCTVRDCNFVCVGGYAARIDLDSHDNRILGNMIAFPGEGGIFFGGPRQGQPGVPPSGNLISGNTIHHGGYHYAHVGGVYMRNANGNTISHNLIHHMPRYGISWKSGAANNVIEYNELHFLDMETNDTGGIECWVSGRGNIVRNNLITDVVGLKHKEGDREGGIESPTYTWGIYLDDESSGMVLENNIIARTILGGIMIHGGGDNIVRNNISVDGRDWQMFYANYGAGDKNNTVERNIYAFSNPAGGAIMGYGFGVKVLKSADSNLYWCPKLPKPTEADSYRVQTGGVIPFAKWQEQGHDVHSVFADPLFVDPAHDNYALKPDSPALKLGFTPIDTSKIGPKGYVPPQ